MRLTQGRQLIPMGTKIINWNIRGLNAYDKQIAVKDLITVHTCLACTIQETKIISLSYYFVRLLWFDDDLFLLKVVQAIVKSYSLHGRMQT